MKRVLYSFVVGILMFGTYSVNAQNKESTIVISEDNLTALINKLRAYKNIKKAEAHSIYAIKDNGLEYGYKIDTPEDSTIFITQDLRQQIAALKTELQLAKEIKDSTNYNKNNDSKLALHSINTELEEIRYYMQTLAEHKTIQTAAAQSVPLQNTDIVRIENPEINTKRNITPIIPLVTTVKTKDKDYIKLQAQYDSLQAVISTNKAANSTKNPALVLQQTNYDAAFTALQSKMDSMRLEFITKNNELTSYETLKAEFKDVKHSIFFANNSVALTIEAKKTANELYALMDKNDNLDLVVKGFASNKGNTKHNEHLSMQRTEAIKKALLLRGLHPTRVLTQYHGIDYNAENEASARRVETSFLIRR